VLYVDLDNFREINERHGELVGESSARDGDPDHNKIRDIDAAARLAGEEFGVILPETERMAPSSWRTDPREVERTDSSAASTGGPSA